MKIIIVGAGEVGFYLASRLSGEHHDVVVIDRDKEAIRRLESLDVQTLRDTGSSPETLKEAGIASADLVVAVTDSDEVNIVACLAANALNQVATKIARIRDASLGRIPGLGQEGMLNLSLVINPEQEVVKTVFRLLGVPGASDVVDLAEGQVKLIGIKVAARSGLSGQKLIEIGQSDLARHFLVAAISREEELIIPSGNDRIMADDLIYLIVSPDYLAQVMELFGATMHHLKRVMVVGGGSLGFNLAQALEKELNLPIVMIERDAERCNFLAETLDRTVILNGSGTDRDLLLEENLSETDALVVVTDDEEENVLISLLGRQLGIRETITRISKLAYMPLVHAVGLERVVSPRMSAANAILQYIRRGKVISVTQIKGSEAEVIEFVALDTSDIVDRPLAKLRFPAGAIIGAIVRAGEMIVPKGDTVIQHDDRVIILAKRDSIAKVEKALTVKLDHF